MVSFEDDVCEWWCGSSRDSRKLRQRHLESRGRTAIRNSPLLRLLHSAVTLSQQSQMVTKINSKYFWVSSVTWQAPSPFLVLVQMCPTPALVIPCSTVHSLLVNELSWSSAKLLAVFLRRRDCPIQLKSKPLELSQQNEFMNSAFIILRNKVSFPATAVALTLIGCTRSLNSKIVATQVRAISFAKIGWLKKECWTTFETLYSVPAAVKLWVPTIIRRGATWSFVCKIGNTLLGTH